MQATHEKSQMEVAYEAVRDLIRQGELTPGLLLSEGQLASRLGMSRTPVREAIGRLAHDGLVTVLSKRGIVVKTLSAADLDDLYTIRGVLEGLSARQAAIRAGGDDLQAIDAIMQEAGVALGNQDVGSLTSLDIAFHTRIARASANKRLEAHLSQIRDVAILDELRARMLADPGRFTNSYKEHTAVLAAINARDPDEAERAMREHVRSSLRWTVDYVDR